ncbi:hypothetical protein [Noviherbaspirillum aerium]|uniref:hypothetical protein n=1 Tax=Noviherbaspirillum aerium TaxID=2588497 RepID=UPI00124DCFAB|nr:hypothetical protein [Noviherbaspirillum aerium]
MTLPELEWQIIYGRCAWAIVTAALAVSLWPRAWKLSRIGILIILAGAAALKALPDDASPAYWLGLAFQWPSAALVGLCLVKLHFAWQGRTGAAMTSGLAWVLALAGAALYIDAIGWISQGFYFWGFGPNGAPALALFFGFACAVAAIRGRARPQALALLFALVTFSVLRLPTGNLWDALLDPILWGWAILALLRQCRNWQARKLRSLAEAEVPAPQAKT